MKFLYYIYQICIAVPLFLVLTILTALVTIIGSLLGGAHIWGYYPGKIWSQLTCYLLLIPVHVVGREKLHKHTSYVFVPNHQGAFDIFLIYGFLGRNFKWMMKKSLRKIPFVGKACESAGHIFVERSRAIWVTSSAVLSSWPMTCNWPSCPSPSTVPLKSCPAQASGYTAIASR